MYRPKYSTVLWNEVFVDCLEKDLQEEKKIYLLGDINRDLLNDQIHKYWTHNMKPFGLAQLVSEPKRVTSDSRTLFDQIYCSCPENVKSVLVPMLGLSDHFPIFLTSKMHNHAPKGKITIIIVYPIGPLKNLKSKHL